LREIDSLLRNLLTDSTPPPLCRLSQICSSPNHRSHESRAQSRRVRDQRRQAYDVLARSRAVL